MKMKQFPMVVTLACVLWLSAHEAQAFYNPSTGRWLSRDPIGTRGGANLYSFTRNDGFNLIDLLGLKKGDGKYSDCGCGKWKVVEVTSVKLWKSDRDLVSDLAHANDVYEQCCIRIKLVGIIVLGQSPSERLIGRNLALEFNGFIPTQDEINLASVRGMPSVHAYYVKEIWLMPFMLNRFGESYPFVKSGFGALTPGFTVANLDKESEANDVLENPIVFAHELGHVMRDGGHDNSDPSYLMAEYGIKRPGADKLTPTECDRMRKSRLLKDMSK